MVTRTWGPEIHALYDSVGDDARFVASFAGLRQAIQARTMVLVSAPAHPNDTLRHIAAVGVPDESLIVGELILRNTDAPGDGRTLEPWEVRVYRLAAT